MRFLNYSSFAQIFSKGMIRTNMTKIANSLLGILTDKDYCVDKNGNSYCGFKGKICAEWYKGESEIYEGIKNAAMNSESQLTISDDIYVVIEACLIPDKEMDIWNELLELVMEAENSSETFKKEAQDIFDSEDYCEFAGRVFLYAVTQQNNQNHIPRSQKKINSSLSEQIKAIREAIANAPKPIVLEVPEELSLEEMEYVSALLEAYSEDAGVVFATKSDLQNYSMKKEYYDDFKDHRKYFYAAEAIRESTRDTLGLEDYQEFDNVKEEIYDGIIDVYKKSYSNGLEKLSNVMSTVVIIPLTSLLAQLTGWVGPKEKKGLCHMLVNDRRLRWVKKDE